MKRILSISLDSVVSEAIDRIPGNKSEFLNQLLKKSLLSENGIKEKISEFQNQIKHLETELDNIRKQRQSKLERISNKLKSKLAEVKSILKEHPDKIYIWVEILNRQYDLSLTSEDLKEIL